MGKKITFSAEVPEDANVQIEAKIIVLPVQECHEEIDLDSLTDDDIDEICDVHYESGDCPLMANCPFGRDCFACADD